MRFEKMGRQVVPQRPLLVVRCMALAGVMEGKIGKIRKAKKKLINKSIKKTDDS